MSVCVCVSRKFQIVASETRWVGRCSQLSNPALDRPCNRKGFPIQFDRNASPSWTGCNYHHVVVKSSAQVVGNLPRASTKCPGPESWCASLPPCGRRVLARRTRKSYGTLFDSSATQRGPGMAPPAAAACRSRAKACDNHCKTKDGGQAAYEHHAVLAT